jgi:hypothetical protein
MFNGFVGHCSKVIEAGFVSQDRKYCSYRVRESLHPELFKQYTIQRQITSNLLHVPKELRRLSVTQLGRVEKLFDTLLLGVGCPCEEGILQHAVRALRWWVDD